MRLSLLIAPLLAACLPAWAQGAGKPTDINLYPSLAAPGGLYDLNVANTQNGPPGTIAVTSATPPRGYSFQDVLANTHGYVEAGVSTGNGHGFAGGVSIPLVPGKAELELEAATGQIGNFKVADARGKLPGIGYDAYSVGLALHPTDDVEAYIGLSNVRLRTSGLGLAPFGATGIGAFRP